jgi:hypothetical protein
MGSTISILNDTESTWLCRVGPDEKALQISGIVASVVTAVGAILVTGGVAGLVSGPLSGMVASSTATVAGGGLFASGVASEGIMLIGHKINRNLIEKGYHEILSGATYETGKLSLSLWQQATCVGQEVLDPTVLNTKTLYMRPIFSGATHKSTNTYSIKEYLERKGKGKVENNIIKLEPNGTSPSTTTA